MCKLYKKLTLQCSRSARRLLIFLCNVLICALVYNQVVFAAETYALKIYINGVDSAQTAVTFPVIGEQRRFQLGRHDGTFDFEGYNTLFDVCVPVTFMADKYYSSTNFSVSVDLVPGFNLSCPGHDVIYSGFYIDNYDFVTGNAIVNSSASIKPGTSILDGSNANIYVSVRLFDMPFRGVTSFTFNVHFLFTSMTASAAFPGDSFLDGQKTAQSFTFSIKGLNNNLYFTSDNVTSNNSEVGKLEDIEGTIRDQREEDRDNAGQAGDDATDLVSNLDTQIKSKWEILWYPIEFTQDLLGVFTGSTARSYSQRGVVGYTYNSRDGTLEPVIDFSRSAVRAVQGTTITFPSFSLMGMQIWEAYDYDLSQVKSDFPALFDAIYVIVSILEVYWFVAFLRNKYEEVFG